MADFNSDRQGDARRAFGDPELSKRVHGRMMETFNVDIRKNGAMRNRAAVLGGLAGLCAAASSIAWVRGAPHLLGPLAVPQHLAKILTWVVVSGGGLAFCVSVSFANERAVYDLELQRELWEIDNHLSGELLEMISVYRSQGLTEEEAHVVTRIFAKQKNLFAALMMVEELGYSRLEPPTMPEVLTNAALPAIVGYVLCFAVPLLPWLLTTCAVGCDSADTVSYSSSSSPSSSSSALASLVAALPLHTTNSRSVKRAGAVILGLATAVLSYLQSEVFFGAYASTRIFCKTAVVNAVGIGSIYALSYMTAKLL